MYAPFLTTLKLFGHEPRLIEQDKAPSPKTTVVEHSLLKRPTSTLLILALTSSALIPAGFGILFYLSLALGSPLGHTTSNHTYIRPSSEGLHLDVGSLHISISALLVSSISSSIV